MKEAHNGLYPNHDRLLCFDKNCPLHQSDINVEIDDNQTNLSNRSSVTSDNTLDSPASMDKDNISSSSTFTDTSRDRNSYSTSTDSISESTSNQSITTTRNDRTLRSNKTFSRTETPKIIISRASNDSLSSKRRKKSSIRRDNDRTSARKRSKNIRRKQKDKRK
jgi:hypothetical protein